MIPGSSSFRTGSQKFHQKGRPLDQASMPEATLQSASRPRAQSVSKHGDGWKYAKFTMDGFTGTKQAVFVPFTGDDLQVDSKFCKKFLTGLKIKPPNLLVEGISTSRHPRHMLTAEDLTTAAFQRLRQQVGQGISEGEVDDSLRDIMMLKLKGICDAILSALEQNRSWVYKWGPSTDCFETLASAAMKDNPMKLTQVASMCCTDPILKPNGKGQQMLQQLFDESEPFNESSVESYDKVVALSGEFIARAGYALSDAIEGNLHSEDDGTLFPPEQRKPTSQFCWPDCDIFVFWYQPTLDGGLDLTPTPYVAGPKTAALAPSGKIFMGGVGAWHRDMALEVVTTATPSVFVRYTGGVAALFSELLRIIKKIIDDDLKTLEKFATSELQHRILSVPDRFALVNPTTLRDHCEKLVAFNTNSCARLSLGHVVQVLDVAKMRPQVFIDTLKVLDPFTQSPEECLNELSACFSSTYTGLMELGASDAQEKVLVNAWRVHRTLHGKAEVLRRRATYMCYAAAALAWLATTAAVILEHIKRLACHQGYSNSNLEPYIQVCKVATVVVPILSSLVGTLGSLFQSKERWSLLALAAADVVRHIFLFRGKAGPYAQKIATNDEKGDNEEDEDESPAAMAKHTRERFVRAINNIYSQVVTSHLKDDVLHSNTKKELHAGEVPRYVIKVLYGQEAPADQASCCPCWRRSVSSRTPRTPMVSEDAEASPFLEEGDLLPPESIAPVEEGDLHEVMDDCVSAISAESYVVTRLRPLIESYTSLTPRLARCSDFLNILIFTFGCVASMLGALEYYSEAIPVVFAFVALTQTLMSYFNPRVHLNAVNSALAGLRSLELNWDGASNMDRRTPAFKENMITTAESLVVIVLQAWAGAVATSQSDGGPQNESNHASKTAGNGKAQGKGTGPSK